ncbi:hypothetical protein BDA96_08G013600 [Sorghum bicolor]|uniref:Uncharacterized protein n=1 Tax=Sorghum bicolor TaxID=4558 RepID=A0A921QDE1_SORBI|nr:hypothetical protein BDA96_08G013600 [Sorghum bicolor]
MVAALSRAPMGYKWLSSEKARITLLNAGKRNVEQDLNANYKYMCLGFGMPKWSRSLECLDIT